MANGTPESTETNIVEEYGSVFDGWQATFGDAIKYGKEATILRDIKEKIDTARPLEVDEEDAQNEVVKEIEEVGKVVDEVIALKTTVTREQRQAVQALPGFVTNALRKINLSGMADPEKAAATPVIHTLLFHASNNPRFDTSNSVSRLLNDLLKVKDFDKDRAAGLMRDIAVHTANKNIPISKTLGDKVDLFLESQDLPKLFEAITEQRLQAEQVAQQDNQDDLKEYEHVRTFEQIIQITSEDPRMRTMLENDQIDSEVKWDLFWRKLEDVYVKLNSQRTYGRMRIVNDNVERIMEKLEANITSKEKLFLIGISSPEMMKLTNELFLLDGTRRKDAEHELLVEGITSPQKEQIVEQQISQLSKEMMMFQMKSVITIFSSVLNEDPDQEFSKKATEGKPSDNPEITFKLMSDMLNQLSNAAKTKEDSAREKGLFGIFRRTINKIEYRPNSKGILEPIHLPSTGEQNVGLSDFAGYLQGVLESGRGMIAYGHNLRFLTQNFVPGADEKGNPRLFFQQISGYAAQELTSDRIDIAYRLPLNELVTAAANKYASKTMRVYHERGWQVTADIVVKELLKRNGLIEEEIKEELVHQYGDLPQWQLDWAFNLARTDALGINFLVSSVNSYADPNLTNSGDPTYVRTKGADGLFDPFYLAKKFASPNFTLKGAVYFPATKDWSRDVWDPIYYSKLGSELWKEKFDLGLAAYDGTEYEGEEMYVDLGNNLNDSVQGGLFVGGGSKLREAYLSWIASELKGPDSRALKGSGDAMITAWKKVENIGIDVLRNFQDQFVMGQIKHGKDGKMDTDIITAVSDLSGFLYERYVAQSKSELDPVRAVLVSEYGISSKEALQKLVRDTLGSSVFVESEKKAFISKLFRKIETILIAEQSPTLFLIAEKKRDTEYGVTLTELIQGEYQDPERLGLNAQQAKELYDSTLSDLVYVEEQLRTESIDEMKRLYRQTGTNWGDVRDTSKTRSDIMGGRGLVITKEYLRKVLERRYIRESLSDADLLDIQAKISNAEAMYQRILDGISTRPTTADVQMNTAIGKDKRGKRKRAILSRASSGDIRSRAEWMEFMLLNNRFGSSFTAQKNAMQFLNMAASGTDTLSGIASGAGTSELIGRSTPGLWGAVKKGSQAGLEDISKSYEPFHEWLGFKGAIQSELGTADTLSFRMAKLYSDVFRESDKFAKSQLKKVVAWSESAPIAHINTLYEPRARVASWDYDKFAGFIGYISRPDIGDIKLDVISNTPQYRELTRREKGIFGETLKKIRVRNYANEFSGLSLRTAGGVGRKELFLYKYLPVVMWVTMLLIIAAIKKGSEDIKIV